MLAPLDKTEKIYPPLKKEIVYKYDFYNPVLDIFLDVVFLWLVLFTVRPENVQHQSKWKHVCVLCCLLSKFAYLYILTLISIDSLSLNYLTSQKFDFLIVIFSKPFLNRCIPTDFLQRATNVSDTIINYLNTSDVFQKVLSDLYTSWKEMLVLCFVAVGTLRYPGHYLFLQTLVYSSTLVS